MKARSLSDYWRVGRSVGTYTSINNGKSICNNPKK
jgi:hypothetical protein